MHESFDVLISTSQFETFGLVVVEALSAGIPCVLSDIPVFRSLFSGCEGVIILSGNDEQDVRSINKLLEQAPVLKNSIIGFWKNNFSNETVKAAWLDTIQRL
jgi:glycosyltransferase involved in cell wall biosynthesis